MELLAGMLLCMVELARVFMLCSNLNSALWLERIRVPPLSLPRSCVSFPMALNYGQQPRFTPHHQSFCQTTFSKIFTSNFLLLISLQILIFVTPETTNKCIY